MKNKQFKRFAYLGIALGSILIVLGFQNSGTGLLSAWFGIGLPLLIGGASTALWLMYRPCAHVWVPVHRGQGHDIVLNIDRCQHCPQERDWLVTTPETSKRNQSITAAPSDNQKPDNKVGAAS